MQNELCMRVWIQPTGGSHSCWHVIVPSRPHQGGGCSTVPLLDITHSTSSQLPPSPSLPVTLPLYTPSHALCLHLSISESLPPSLYFPPSSYASLEWSPLSFIASIMCLSFPCSRFFFSPATSHPSITSPTLNSPPNSSHFISVYLGLYFPLSPCTVLPCLFLVFLPTVFFQLLHIVLSWCDPTCASTFTCHFISEYIFQMFLCVFLFFSPFLSALLCFLLSFPPSQPVLDLELYTDRIPVSFFLFFFHILLELICVHMQISFHK